MQTKIKSRKEQKERKKKRTGEKSSHGISNVREKTKPRKVKSF